METCNRISLQHVHILQGAALYRELGEECIRCQMKRKRFIEVSMGPVSQNQLAIAPPMWTAQLDLFGPCYVYVPGYERQTRAHKALATEVHVMVFACPATRLINLQVIEGKNSSCILDGITRMSCEIGVPKYLLIDSDDAIKKALRELEVDVKDLEFKLHKEKGIVFDVCPVAGHNAHGQVERVIRSVQESLNDCGVRNLKLHATGLQTFLKLVENTYNNAPLGFSHGRDVDNGSILKTISPNMLRVGRNNERALEGNFRFPTGGSEMIEKVDKLYKAWYMLWKDAVVPKLIRQPKWFKTDKHLKPGDLVYFEKETGKVNGVWIVGRVDQVVRSSDGLIRKPVVAYRNSRETFNRLTSRAVRTLVKLFSVDEGCVQDDLAILQKRIDRIKQNSVDVTQTDVNLHGHRLEEVHLGIEYSNVYEVLQNSEGSSMKLRCLSLQLLSEIDLKPKFRCFDRCCCLSHCLVRNHHTYPWKKAKQFTNPFISTVIEEQKDYEVLEEWNVIGNGNDAEAEDYCNAMEEESITKLLMSITPNLHNV